MQIGQSSVQYLSNIPAWTFLDIPGRLALASTLRSAYVPTMPRRSPPPWTTIRTEGGWRVNDATGRPLAYVYGHDDQGAGSHHLTVDEARRIAVNIAKLPELLQRAKARDTDL